MLADALLELAGLAAAACEQLARGGLRRPRRRTWEQTLERLAATAIDTCCARAPRRRASSRGDWPMRLMSAVRAGATIAVALHDIEPATFERCALIRDWLDDHGVDRVTLLVIPARDLHPARRALARRWSTG